MLLVRNNEVTFRLGKKQIPVFHCQAWTVGFAAVFAKQYFSQKLLREVTIAKR